VRRFSIILPTWQEAAEIVPCLKALQLLRRQAEIIVVDGGSRDDTPALTRPLADQVVTAAKGRASQMNAGATIALGKILIFLHADTRLPDDALDQIERAIASGHLWGRFDVRLDSGHPLLSVVASCINLRSRLSGIATGDQALFVTRQAFEAVGGFPSIPLMEDIELSKRLKNTCEPACLKAKVTTSARRWENFGVLKTIGLMWWLRLGYFLGADPCRLNTLYRTGRFW